MRPIFLLLVASFAVCYAQQNQQAGAVNWLPAPQKLPAKPANHEFYKGYNDYQRMLLTPNGILYVVQLLQEKTSSMIKISDPARRAEIFGYMYELLEWGPQGPPGGFSIKSSIKGVPVAVKPGTGKRHRRNEPHIHARLVFRKKKVVAEDGTTA
ncbi:unnamed protein product [Caenorhabditis auriculariae]|uniref:Uncharacterized protein n=1 Tax=Caenorhabditis auriculariae TaxID=2777116 RepID=A0A8S1GT36_9PELO|nr:unnamed protein product [Caenorhabditis auriculariae]